MIYLYLGVALVAIYFIYRFYHRMARVEPCDIEITQHDVRSPVLPSELDGFTICQLSDLHISAKPRNREQIAAALSGIYADLFVLTGDMIFGEPGIDAFLTWFDGIADKVRPAFAVLGNAEHKPHFCTRDFQDELRKRGVILLVNKAIEFITHGDAIQIVGVDDPHTHHEDFAAAYADADSNLWTLLLCHSPDGLATIGSRRADLMLCGHTHGGQIILWKNGWRWGHTHRVKGFVSGWFPKDEILRAAPTATGVEALYISRGLGMGHIPFRLNCRPEIAVFALRKQEN